MPTARSDPVDEALHWALYVVGATRLTPIEKPRRITKIPCEPFFLRYHWFAGHQHT